MAPMTPAWPTVGSASSSQHTAIVYFYENDDWEIRLGPKVIGVRLLFNKPLSLHYFAVAILLLFLYIRARISFVWELLPVSLSSSSYSFSVFWSAGLLLLPCPIEDGQSVRPYVCLFSYWWPLSSLNRNKKRTNTASRCCCCCSF